MDKQTPPDWTRIAELLDAVLDLAPDDRAQRLGELGASAAEIERVETMLAHEQTRGPELNPLIKGLAALQDELETGRDGTVEGAVLGRWRLVRPLGEGGMASVWLAERADGTVDQQVALKCLKAGLYSPELRDLFAREQQILARLQHPHIARMYDSGIADNGLPYLVMELIDGEPLTTWCDRQRLDPGERLALFDQVLDALLFAHRELIVHRDLKPANILVDRRGDLKLLDFGIARLIDDTSPDQPLTRYRALTPEYAAPEQLAGERVGLSADIYALGLLLHELLAGRRASRDPIERQLQPASSQVMRADADFDPAASAERRRRTPARLKQELRGDLDAIINRCLAERPEDRYPGVDSLRQDLEAWRQRRPVSARRVGPGHRARLFLKRHWLPTSTLTAVLLAMGLGTAIALNQANRAEAEAQAARSAQRQAEAAQARAVAVREFVVELFRGEIPLLPADQLPTTRQIVDRGVERAQDPDSGPPEVRAEMLTVLGEILTSRQQYDEAAALLEEAMRLMLASPEPDLEWLAEALENATMLAHSRRDLDAAQDYAARLVALLEQIQPDSTNLFFAQRMQLSIDLDRLALPVAAARIEGLLARVERHSDPEADAIKLTLLGDLGVLHGRHGDLVAAGEAFHRQLTLRLADPDARVDVLANTMNNLGYLYQELGQLSLAASYYRQALDRTESVEERPLRQRANAHHGLAGIFWRQGRHEAALDEVDRAWREWLRLLAAKPEDDRLFPAVNRGLILARAGRHHEAAPEPRLAWALMTEQDDIIDQQRAEVALYLALSLCALGETEEAETWLSRGAAHRVSASESLEAEARAYCQLRSGLVPDPDQALPMALVLGDEARLGDRILVVRRELLRADLLEAAGREAEARAARISARNRLTGSPDLADHPILLAIDARLRAAADQAQAL